MELVLQLGGNASTGSMLGSKLEYSNFFFNGIPDGKYSLTSKENIFELLINALRELIDFFTGLITYLFRGLIIGIISVFDRLINNTIKSVNESPQDLQDAGVKATNADDPMKMHRSVTIEGLIFNNIDLFDINIFKVDDEDSKEDTSDILDEDGELLEMPKLSEE